MQDLRFAARALRKQPLFTLVAVMTLALGVGANTAIFSLLYRVLLRPLPYQEPSRLVLVWNTYLKAGHDMTRVAIPDYLDRRAEAPALEEAALFTTRDASLSIAGQPERLTALAVTPSFFPTLGRGPLLGRAFVDSDATAGSDRVAILTYSTWRSRFGSDPAIVGRPIHLNGGEYLVVGVLPSDFEVPWPAWRDTALLVPFSFTAAQRSDQERGNEFSLMIGRLRPGASIQQLNAQMQAIVSRLMDRVPGRASYMRNSGFTGIATGLREELVHDVRLSLYLLQAGVLVVLLIACVNVANLLLMRASGRARELAIRVSLGAGPWRIARQLLIEGGLLSIIGAGIGLAVGAAGLRALVTMTAEQMPVIADTTIRPAVLLFTLGITFLTTVVFGLLPALAAGRRRLSALRDDSNRGSAGRKTGRLRTVLVVAETALAVVLVIGATLLVASFTRVLRVAPGFATDRVLTTRISLPDDRYKTSETQRAFWTRLLEKAGRIPGVASAGLVSSLPFDGRPSAGSYTIVGRQLGPDDRPPHAGQDLVVGDYFRAMRIPLLDGRPFSESDTATAPRVVIVDQLFAMRQFPHESAVGHQINFGSPRNYTIVGVVGTINADDLARPVGEERIYLNAAQVTSSSMMLVVKTALEPTTLTAQLRAAVQEIDPEQPIDRPATMDEWVDKALTPRRTPMTLLSLFGFLALTLAAIGVYGVLAFGVAQRVREFGIRQAVGASPRAILSLVLRQGLTTTGAGICAGLAAAFVATRYLESMLFGIRPHDPVVFLGVAGLFVVVAMLASCVPAARAMRVDPMIALREE